MKMKEACPASMHVSVCMRQVKKPATMSFLPLREALAKPEPFMETDFAKIGRPGVLHQAFQGLDKVNVFGVVRAMVSILAF